MTKSEYQELVEFLGAKFARIDRRFDAIDERLDAIEGRLDAMDRRFDAMDRRFDAMDERFGAVWSELRSVRTDMAAGFNAQAQLIRGLGSRVSHLEA